jgi:hypothetical protein
MHVQRSAIWVPAFCVIVVSVGYLTWSPEQQRATIAPVQPSMLAHEPNTTRHDAAPSVSEPAQVEQQPEPRATAPLRAEELAANVLSGDARVRAHAITALASASKTEGVPILKRVVMSGEPKVDRPLALRALRDLALHQGDDDQRVRDVVRQVVYHGDDEALSLAAQEVLDIIGESELE